MRTWLFRLLIPIGIAAVVVWFTLLRSDPVTVRVALVDRADVESTITNSKAGTVKARHRARLSAEVGGRVVATLKRTGEWVKRDEVIVSLNDATPRAQLMLAQESLRVADAARREACIARDRALRELNRKRSLAAGKIISVDLLDALESAHDAAQAACIAVTAERDKAKAAILAAEAGLAKYTIRAPFDGIIAEMTAEVGEWITPSPPLLTAPSVVDIIDPTSVYVSAPMDEVDSASIHPGQRAKITVDSHPGAVFTGRVHRVAPYVLAIEAQNRTVEIEAEFDDPELATSLLAGTSADIEVILEIHENVLRIPTSALREGRSVLIPEAGVLVEREIEIGLKNWDFAEVTRGLSEGDQVVVSLDRVEVQPGADIEIEEPTDTP
ncbi:MAG: efflux RND transporter periplasmic adaptor subunit [Deltaproteobacteria bacterium]|nr:efflux RND transporter periplasmic adaptor subunit [Deltaproteobacteria bacterium]